MKNKKGRIAYLNSRASTEAIDNADQVEWDALDKGASSIEFGIYDDKISGKLTEGITKTTSNPAWNQRIETVEAITGSIAEEIERRQMLLGNAYPFSLRGNELHYTPRRGYSLCYEFCLAISMSPSLSKKPFNALPIAFERFACSVIASWLGEGASAWQTGWPGYKKSVKGGKLQDLWARIFQVTQEWEWSPGREVPDDAPDNQKDLGVDILVWKAIDDLRTGNIFIVGQCACGRDAVEGDKSSDLNEGWLRQWFRATPLVPIVRSLLLPRCLGSSANALRVRSTAGIVFDRIRLVLISRSAKPTLAKDLRIIYNNSRKMVLNYFREARQC